MKLLKEHFPATLQQQIMLCHSVIESAPTTCVWTVRHRRPCPRQRAVRRDFCLRSHVCRWRRTRSGRREGTGTRRGRCTCCFGFPVRRDAAMRVVAASSAMRRTCTRAWLSQSRAAPALHPHRAISMSPPHLRNLQTAAGCGSHARFGCSQQRALGCQAEDTQAAKVSPMLRCTMRSSALRTLFARRRSLLDGLSNRLGHPRPCKPRVPPPSRGRPDRLVRVAPACMPLDFARILALPGAREEMR